MLVLVVVACDGCKFIYIMMDTALAYVTVLAYCDG
jgi:hypothetical protein